MPQHAIMWQLSGSMRVGGCKAANQRKKCEITYSYICDVKCRLIGCNRSSTLFKQIRFQTSLENSQTQRRVPLIVWQIVPEGGPRSGRASWPNCLKCVFLRGTRRSPRAVEWRRQSLSHRDEEIGDLYAESKSFPSTGPVVKDRTINWVIYESQC